MRADIFYKFLWPCLETRSM